MTLKKLKIYIEFGCLSVADMKALDRIGKIIEIDDTFVFVPYI